MGAAAIMDIVGAIVTAGDAVTTVGLEVVSCSLRTLGSSGSTNFLFFLGEGASVTRDDISLSKLNHRNQGKVRHTPV